MMDLEKVERALGYTFKNKELLINALTHSSYGLEATNNERLEFLGDAVLELVISEYLYRTQHIPEGKMTRLRANIVCTESLAKAAMQNHFNDELRMGKGERASGGKNRRRNLANVFEAVMGGVFLDSSYETVREVILRVLHENIELAIEGKLAKDYKSTLQELIQKQKDTTIEYRDLGSTGPQHNQLFKTQLVINGFPKTTGRGKTKKEAQQVAAREYLKSGEI